MRQPLIKYTSPQSSKSQYALSSSACMPSINLISCGWTRNKRGPPTHGLEHLHASEVSKRRSIYIPDAYIGLLTVYHSDLNTLFEKTNTGSMINALVIQEPSPVIASRIFDAAAHGILDSS